MTAKPVGPANCGAFIPRLWLGGKVIPDCFIVLTGFSGREWTNRWTAKKKQGAQLWAIPPCGREITS